MSEIKKPQSPAERAKEFAADNGFEIVTVGRRYRITRNNMHNVTITEVGGYPAALNAMKTQVRADELAMCTEFESKPVEMCAGGTLVLPEPSADPALNATANNCFGALEPITPDTVPMSREEMFAPVKAELDRLKQRGVDEHAQRVMLAQSNATFGKMAPSWAHKTADEIKADIVAGIEMLAQQSRDYNDLEYGTGDTLDAVAKRMGRAARKLSGEPPGGPWRVTYLSTSFGLRVRTDYRTEGFPSRAAALAKVRYLLSDRLTHSWWKRAAVTVEYRA